MNKYEILRGCFPTLTSVEMAGAQNHSEFAPISIVIVGSFKQKPANNQVGFYLELFVFMLPLAANLVCINYPGQCSDLSASSISSANEACFRWQITVRPIFSLLLILSE